LKHFYWPHHKSLGLFVENQIGIFNSALILDCHSFTNEPLKWDINKTPNRPDFNMGTDSFLRSSQ